MAVAFFDNLRERIGLMGSRATRCGNIIAASCAILLSIGAVQGVARSEENSQSANRAEVSLPTLAPLIKRVLPAVVAVRTIKPAAIDSRMVDPAAGFPEGPLPREQHIDGSGVIVDAERGLILTSNHVIDNAGTITATLADGRSAPAVLLTTSQEDDLAVLRIALRGITAVALAKGQGADVGDFVLAIGYPLGLGQSTTFGIVSALHRSCPGIRNTDLIQTDATLDQGNSGGALLNIQGELVGINVARVGRSSGGGFGFAVPIDAIRAILASVALDY